MVVCNRPASWGGEFDAFPELAVEAGFLASAEERHEGTCALGYYRRGAGQAGGLVFNAGTTDWTFGLTGGDAVVERRKTSPLDV